ncbi:dirigent protein 21-like [Spinacia oleracea]|uniref:Dirigent protein n=1 Tax=Spinacia oleracea TaxID=3562 RepID=A0A9R0IA66_SPIOL|nr:dirigent protein 21-like [Spinacia oleracea]
MSIPIIFLFSLLILSFYIPKNNAFSKPITKEEMGLKKQQNLTHLHFYFHDYVQGSNQTALRIAQAPSTNKSSSGFGALVMIDDPLTEGPEHDSKIVGYAQGMYGFADQKQPGLVMVMNYVFVEGEYNGSTLSLLGRNQVMNKVREMSIVGGSGVFRFATGYAQAKTVTLLDKFGASVVEYDVYVQH